MEPDLPGEPDEKNLALRVAMAVIFWIGFVAWSWDSVEVGDDLSGIALAAFLLILSFAVTLAVFIFGDDGW